MVINDNFTLIRVEPEDVDKDGKCVIPYGVKTIGENACLGNNSLCSVVLPSSVTEICDSSFERCDNLKTINLPQGLTKIGIGAFYHCYSLENIVIPEGVEILREYTFEECSDLECIHLPQSLKEISVNVFAYCDSLTRIELPNQLERISEAAFGSSGLIEITIPSSTQIIDELAFANCSNLKNIAFNNGLEIIHRGAFANCPELTKVIIPESVKKINDEVFYDCINLKRAVIPEKTFVSDDAFCGCHKDFKIERINSKTEKIEFDKSANLFDTLVIGYGSSNKFDKNEWHYIDDEER